MQTSNAGWFAFFVMTVL